MLNVIRERAARCSPAVDKLTQLQSQGGAAMQPGSKQRRINTQLGVMLKQWRRVD